MYLLVMKLIFHFNGILIIRGEKINLILEDKYFSHLFLKKAEKYLESISDKGMEEFIKRFKKQLED